MKKRILSMLLAVVMVVGFWPAGGRTAFAANEVDYTLVLVSGVVYKNNTLSDIVLNGADYGIQYANGVYTFTNVNFTTTKNTAIVISGDATVQLVGDNYLRGGSSDGLTYGLEATGVLTITGSGSLTAVAGNSSSGLSYGINTNGLTMESGTVFAQAGSAQNASLGVYVTCTNPGSKLTMTGGTLTGVGDDYGIYARDIAGATGVTVTGTDSKDGANAAQITGWNGQTPTKKWMRLEKAPTVAHTHCVCGKHGCTDASHGGTVTYLPWSEAIGNSTGVANRTAHVYLDDDRTLGARGLTITKGATLDLCLNGFELNVNGAYITVSDANPVTVTLSDCGTGGKITGAVEDERGILPGAISIGNNVTFTMYSGAISDNGNRAFYIDGKSSVNIVGGTISGNSTDRNNGGGAIYLQRGDLFVGGNAVIRGNTAPKGGAIATYPYSGNVVNLHIGGSAVIRDNIATSSGGAVYIAPGGGGTYGSVAVSGNATIYDNYVGNGISNVRHNLMVYTTLIDFTGLGNAAKVGVYRVGDFPTEGNPVQVSTANAPVGANALVTSDNPAYKIIREADGALYMVVPPPHQHAWDTNWTVTDTYHWHVCLDVDCPLTEYSSVIESGYGVHVYDQEIQSPAYEQYPPSCYSAGKYYKSCICGKKGTDTFLVPAYTHDFVYSAQGDSISERCIHNCFYNGTATINPPENLVYDGTAKEATISYTGSTYDLKPTLSYTKNGQPVTEVVEAGDYVAVMTFRNATAQLPFTVAKQSVKPPVIASKTYTGEHLTADIQDTDLYTVVTNEGGVDAGYYIVSLRLKNGRNYQWEGYSTARISLNFCIEKRSNSWITTPAIADWTYGGTASEPVGEAEYGPVTFLYYGSMHQQLTNKPTDAGSYYMRATGSNTINYESLTSDFIPFTISPRPLLSTDFSVDASSCVYSGNPVVPTLTCVNALLTAEDYTVQYANNTNAGTGTAKIIITGQRNASGTVEIPFSIAPKTLSDPTIQVADAGVYDGMKKRPAVSVYDGTTLIPASEYTVEYRNNINAGTDTAKVILTDKAGGNYIVSGTQTFSIGKSDSVLTPGGVMNATYGDTFTMSVRVSLPISTFSLFPEEKQVSFYYSGTLLGTVNVVNGLASLSYDTTKTHTIPVGTPQTVDVYYGGTGNLNTAIGSISVTISKAPLTVIPTAQTKGYGAADPVLGYTYSGQIPGETPAFRGGMIRVAGEDAGTYPIIPSQDFALIDNGAFQAANYQLMISAAPVYFTITPKTVSAPTIEVANGGVYDGKEKTPTVVVKDGDVVIPATEYMVAYTNNIHAGTATVTITDNAGGNYTVRGTTNFTIAPRDLADAAITLVDALTYNSQEQTQNVIVSLEDLVVTYTISGHTGTTAGAYTLRIAGTGDFTGAKTQDWRIAQAKYDMSGVTFASASHTFDGTEKTLVISGTLPAGVTVRYEDNTLTNVGSVTAKAIFTGDSINYEAIPSKTAVLTVTNATFQVTAAGYDGVYDGQPHTISVQAAGASITYSTDGVHYEASCPAFRDAGSYTVYYKAVKPNHADALGSAVVHIAKATPVVGIASDHTSLYGGGIVTLTVSGVPAEGTYIISCDRPVQRNANGTYTLPNATQSYTFTLSYAESANYTAASAICRVSVSQFIYIPPMVKQYTLSFDVNGGMPLPSITQKAGTTIDVSAYQITREGYRFDGWYADAALTHAVASVKLDRNITVYAGWTPDAALDTSTVPAMLNGRDHIAYIVGYEDDMVRPDADITRAEVATFFFRLLKEEVRNAYLTSENEFLDVPSDMWYTTSVSTMAAMGILKGYDGYFRPGDPITRAEFATIAARFADTFGTLDPQFQDISGHWAESDIRKAASFGWIEGYNGYYRPGDAITRAEAMTIINRILCRIPETVEDLLPGMKVWADNMDTSKWYYLAVQEATNSHTFQPKDEVYEIWVALIADPDWSLFE